MTSVVIEKEDKNPHRFVTPRHFTASARAAFEHSLSRPASPSRNGVLLPAYVGFSKKEGSGVFDPVRASGRPYDFYRVDRRLVPDLDDLERCLRSGRFDTVLLIHYFGVPQTDPVGLTELCHRYDARLVEDCAHSILGGLGPHRLGTTGDYAIFSIHKSTASVAGGFFLDNRGDVAPLPLAPRHRIDAESMSLFANTDLIAASMQRRENYLEVERWVRGISGLELFFSSLPNGTVPLNCPVWVQDGRREKLYFALIERDLHPTALYHTLISELDPERFPEGYEVARTILNLPTHAGVGDAGLQSYQERLIDAVTEVWRQ